MFGDAWFAGEPIGPGRRQAHLIIESKSFRKCASCVALLRAIPFNLSADAHEAGLVDKKRRNRVLRELDDSEGW